MLEELAGCFTGNGWRVNGDTREIRKSGSGFGYRGERKIFDLLSRLSKRTGSGRQPCRHGDKSKKLKLLSKSNQETLT